MHSRSRVFYPYGNIGGFGGCIVGHPVSANGRHIRLKAEIIGKKKIGKFDENSEEAKEFEESLLKLANLAKDRVKFSEFTTQDRNNLLDLFVNNEKTLLRIYENLFPKKGGHAANTSSLRQISTLKNSSDTIRFGQKSDFLKGDSLH